MKITKEFKTGIFVIVTILAVILTVNYLRGNGFLQKNQTFFTTYSDVQGLNPATPVYINGFKAGSVTSITFDKNAKVFKLKISVSKDFDIPDDSRTEIFSSDILGGKAIRIICGTSASTALSGDELPGFVCADPLSSVMGGLPSVLEKFDTLVAKLHITVDNLNDILDRTNRDNISSLIKHLKESSERIESITSHIDEKSPEISEFITNLNNLSKSLQESAIKLDSTLANTRDISAQLNEAGLKELIGNINSAVVKIQDPSGSLGQLMVSDSLHNSLTTLVRDIDTLVNKIKENPKKNLKISVF
ncbi:MAG: MCE family protein [Alistipes sp.]|nr:MCE family protein [Candidatus Minthomonas equi]